MTIEGIDAEALIARAKAQLLQEPGLSPALKTTIDLLLLLIGLLLNRHGPNSNNSSKPPSTDPNRKKISRQGTPTRQPGGQPGHQGTTLMPVDDPDEIAELRVDQRTLAKGLTYRPVGVEKRQVIDLYISRRITEFQAEVLEDSRGKRWTADFPEGVKRPVQYGAKVKEHAVYLSQQQLLPYHRVQEHFSDQLQLSMSVATLGRFNQQAYARLAAFETWIKPQLTGGPLLHVDETGINVNGKRRWLHVACTERLTWLAPHDKRGTQAMAAIGIVPHFTGVLCHDHWKPYYTYKDCQHALCNAHHLRELTRAAEQDNQRWAGQLKDLLLELNQAVNGAGGYLSARQAKPWRLRYRKVLAAAEQECPPPEIRPPGGKRGRPKRSKARNLLERLRTFESDVLWFMTDAGVPFTNNQGENDLRMTKVQQKISGCFRSNKGAETFCRVRSYLATCRKNGVPASEALALLFRNDWPAFMLESGILGCGAAE